MTATNAKVRVSGPDGAPHEVAITEQAPGVYSGAFEANEIGSYIVTVAEPDDAGGQRVTARGFIVTYPPEYRTTRTNRPLLAQITEVGRGKEISTPEQAMRPVVDPGASITELWPYLLFFAAFLLPVDVGIRRVALPFAEIMAKVLARLRLRRPPPEVAQVEIVDRLQQAKRRVQTPSSGDPATATPRISPAARESKPESEVTAPSGSAAQNLLEAKRRRKGDD
jgi:hypothetical protein